MVYQQFINYPHLNVFENVAFPLKQRKVDDQEINDVVLKSLKSVGLEGYENRKIQELSGGQQQRVSLARSLVKNAKILLLDEPMAGMNVEEKEDISRFILDVNDEFGTTIALIEHDMGVVMDLSDRAVVMDYGKKIGDGTPEEVRNNQAVIDAYLGVSHD